MRDRFNKKIEKYSSLHYRKRYNYYYRLFEYQETAMRILAIGAHPDDVELGLGGCLVRHADKGDTVNVLIFSRGEGGVPDEALTEGGQMDEEERSALKGKLREKETKDALTFLGVKEEDIKILGLPDASIDITRGTLEVVYQQVMRLQPDIIYTHYLEEDHLDHVRTSLISLHAARKAKTILFYESPSTRTSFSPNYFVDVANHLARKIEALKMHKTQAEKLYMDEDVIESKARFRGFQAKVLYAEAFVVHRMKEV